MGKAHLNIADYITISRVVFALSMFFLACLGERWAFIIVFALAAFSDKLDGVVARSLKIESYHGARLDAIADQLMLMILVPSLYLLEKKMILDNIYLIIYIAMTFIISRFFVYAKRKKIDKYPMSLFWSKSNLIIVNIGTLIVLITGKSDWFRYGLIYLSITYTLARIEEVLIHYRYKKVPYKIRSAFRKS